MALESVSAASLHGPLKQIRQGAKKYMLKAVIQMDNFFVLSSRFLYVMTFCMFFKIVDLVKNSFDLSMLRIPKICTAEIG